MNAVRKFASRVFQKIMHVAIPILPDREPKLLHTHDDVVKILKENKIENVMIVTDKGIRNL